MRDSRRLIRAGELFGPEGGCGVLGVGELLPLAGARRGAMPAPPLDVSRTIEEALSTAPLDFVHVHEPFAPSAASVALRHSRALNVGTFHAPAERVLSTQVARRFVELFFGRLDARTASFEATRELMQRVFPADYRVAAPGRRRASQRADARRPVHIAFCDQEERGALRLFLRALRRLPPELDWQATVFMPSGAAPTEPLAPARPRARALGAGHDRGRGARLGRRRGRRLARRRARAGPARARARRGRRAGRVAPPRLRGGRCATATSGCCSSPATSRRSPRSSSG